MKKKNIISIIICLVSVIGITEFILWNNRTVSTITLDINPSIEINLDKNEKVKSIIALNDDAKEIIDNNIKGKKLEEAFEALITNLVEKGYVDDNNLQIVLHTEGKVTNEDLAKQIEFEFGKKEIHTEIITVDSITKEDEKLAKEYGVSPAKISYIKTIIEENKNIDIKDLANKSVSEINETKTTGKYCESGYTLEGDWCLKEINRTQALQGNVCPDDYTEYEGKCYEEVRAIETNNYLCSDGLKLINDICISEEIGDALVKCDTGKYDNGYCVSETYVADAYEFCRDSGRTLYEHKCLATKPTINGGCLGSDMLYKGKCVNTRNDYYMAEWKCPDGRIISNADGSLLYEDKKCYTEKKTKPTSYYCDGNGELNGTKCVIKHTEKPQKERTCPSGYTPVDDGSRCLNFNKTASKENGYYCEQESSRIDNKTCIIYEMVEAKSY